jgi:DNA-binding IclR family transcriptional regulator
MNQSIKKAFEILSFVAENPVKMSLSEMSASLKMNKTTLYRFLATMESLDILCRRDEHYVPGIRLFELGSKVPVKQLIVAGVHPVLSRLTAEVNETVNLGELRSNQVFYLDKTESLRSLQIQTSVGSYIALHATALGKSILSILPEALRESIIRQLDFKPLTPNTITDPVELKSQVEKVWTLGYSSDDEEWEEGLRCVAVPLLIEELNFYGSISCSGPTVRFTPRRMKELAKKLKQTVEDITKSFAESRGTHHGWDLSAPGGK